MFLLNALTVLSILSQVHDIEPLKLFKSSAPALNSGPVSNLKPAGAIIQQETRLTHEPTYLHASPPLAPIILRTIPQYGYLDQIRYADQQLAPHSPLYTSDLEQQQYQHFVPAEEPLPQTRLVEHHQLVEHLPLMKETMVEAAPVAKGAGKLAKLKNSIAGALGKLSLSSYHVTKEELIMPPVQASLSLNSAAPIEQQKAIVQEQVHIREDDITQQPQPLSPPVPQPPAQSEQQQPEQSQVHE